MRGIIFNLSLALSLMLVGCGQVEAPQAVVKPSRATVQIPKAESVQHVYVVAGGAGVTFTPKNQPETISQVEDWLGTAKAVSVQLPQYKTRHPTMTSGVTSVYTGPAVLILQISPKQEISISPVCYMWGNSQELSLLYHYVDGVISYQVGNKTVYFKDPELYNWLKSNQWQKQFNTKWAK